MWTGLQKSPLCISIKHSISCKTASLTWFCIACQTTFKLTSLSNTESNFECFVKKLKNHFWIVESTVLCLKFAVLIVSQYDIHLQKIQILFAQILFWTLFYFDDWQFCLIFPLKKSCINSISLDIWQVCPICWWHPLRPDIPQGIPS